MTEHAEVNQHLPVICVLCQNCVNVDASHVVGSKAITDGSRITKNRVVGSFHSPVVVSDRERSSERGSAKDDRKDYKRQCQK